MRYTISIKQILFGLIAICSLSSCKKFIEIESPRTELVKSTVFSSEATANAAVVDLYYQLSRTTSFASGNQGSISFVGGLSADELINYSIQSYNEFYENQITPANNIVSSFWSDAYTAIYKSNAIIEGLSSPSDVAESSKKQFIGEAKFVRAYSYFYLTNLFGDVPLITSTDYKVNNALPRSSQTEIYQQIIIDLKDAQAQLSDDYSFSDNERVRANKWAATALLARTYLYIADWSNAESEASGIINNSARYSLVTDLTKLMVKNNTEAIWQFHNTFYPNDLLAFYIFSAPPYTGALTSQLINCFEAGDQRKLNWIGSITDGINIYYFPMKYQSFTSAEEYSTLLRLAEQYLIRAEARAKQGKLTGVNSAESDINIIRERAGLGTTSATTQAQLLSAIEQERRVELFTEHGHRWLDLKRWDKADVILAPVKGSNWQVSDVLYPIPQYQILNSSLTQNPGY